MSDSYSNRKGITTKDVLSGVVIAGLLTIGTCGYISKYNKVDSLEAKTDSLEAKTQNDALHIYDLRTGLDSLEGRVYSDSVRNYELGGIIDALGFKNEKLEKDKSRLSNEISRLKKAGANPDYIAKLEGEVNALGKERDALINEVKNYRKALENSGDAGSVVVIDSLMGVIKGLKGKVQNSKEGIDLRNYVPIKDHRALENQYIRLVTEHENTKEELAQSQGASKSGKRNGNGKRTFMVKKNMNFFEKFFNFNAPRKLELSTSEIIIKDDKPGYLKAIYEIDGQNGELNDKDSGYLGKFDYPPTLGVGKELKIIFTDEDGNKSLRYLIGFDDDVLTIKGAKRY